MVDVQKWDKDPAGSGRNGIVSPGGAQDNWTGKEINEWGREIMAAIKRYYDDTEYVDPFDELTPEGGTLLVRVSASQFTIDEKNCVSLLPDGTRIRITSAGGTANNDMFVLGTPIFTTLTTVNVIGGAVPVAPDAGGLFVTSNRSLAAHSYGGFGTTIARDITFPATPGPEDGILWYNTDPAKSYWEMGIGGVWVPSSAGALHNEASTSYVQTTASSLGESAALQNIEAGLKADAGGMISNDATAPLMELQAIDKRVGLWRWADPDVFLDVYDDADGTTLLASYRFGADGQLLVDDQGGGGFTPVGNPVSTFEDTTPQTISGWTQVANLPFPGNNLGDSATIYRVSVSCYVNDVDVDGLSIHVGGSDDITDTVYGILNDALVAGFPSLPPGSSMHQDGGGDTTAFLYLSTVFITEFGGVTVSIGVNGSTGGDVLAVYVSVEEIGKS